MAQIQLQEREIRLLMQSLEHCLATCEQKASTGNGPCQDCDAATALKKRLESLLPP